MTPGLTTQGGLLVGTVALFLGTGVATAEWVLISLGTILATAMTLEYLAFLHTATLLRRQRIEFAWWVQPGGAAGGALVAGHPFSLTLFFRNRSGVRFDGARVGLLTSPALEVHYDPPLSGSTFRPSPDGRNGPAGSFEMAIGSLAEAERRISVTARAAGYWFFHGAVLELVGRFGSFRVLAYFPNPLGVKVFPRLAAAPSGLLHRPAVGTPHDRAGRHFLRRRGLGTDLREIRDHTSGDPFKRIAWKATARSGRLMVREFESEIVVGHHLIVDASSTMREGPVGRSKLDGAIELTAAYAKTALEENDRVGLLAFDARILAETEPKDGRRHLVQIIDRLLELQCPVDEDLTDLTDAELVAKLSAYLRHQEGLDFRVPKGPKPPPGGSAEADGGAADVHRAGAAPEVGAGAAKRNGRRSATGADGSGGAPGSEPPIGSAAEPDRIGGFLRDLDGTWHDLEAMARWIGQALKEESRPRGLGWRPVRASSPQLGLLREFARRRGLELPYLTKGAPGAKDQGLADALTRAAQGRGARVIVLISDLEGLGDHPGREPIRRAIALCRSRRQKLVVFSPQASLFVARPPGLSEATSAIVAAEARRRRAGAVRDFESQGIAVHPIGPLGGARADGARADGAPADSLSTLLRQAGRGAGKSGPRMAGAG